MDQSRTYLNNAGSTWPKPESVIEAMTVALKEPPTDLEAALDRATDDVARFLGLASPEGMLWTSGCTAALHAAITNLPWAAGDRIITSDLEHQAVEAPIQRLVRDLGVGHEVVPYRAGAPCDLDALRALLRSGGVRLVVCTTASNVSGEILPTREIVELAHEHGALCLLDAAQTVGVMPTPIAEAGADLFVIAGHKGPLGPQGVGLLWAGPSVRFACPTAVCEVGDTVSARPGYCEVGGINRAGVLALAEGTRWLVSHPAAFERARDHAVSLAAELRQRSFCTVYGGEGARTATVSFRVAGLPLAQAEALLRDRGFVVRAGEHCAPRAVRALGVAEGTVRASFGPFNTPDDVRGILRAIDELGERSPQLR